MRKEKEFFKEINYEGNYFKVFNDGSIYTKSYLKVRNNGFKLTIKAKRCFFKKTSHGYLAFSAYGKRFYVHRIICFSFIENKENKPQVNHINGIKYDNRVENLEWVTHRENAIHAYKIGLHKNTHIASIGNKNAKRRFILDFTNGVYYESIKEVSDLYGIKYTTLCNKLTGHRRNDTNFIYA